MKKPILCSLFFLGFLQFSICQTKHYIFYPSLREYTAHQVYEGTIQGLNALTQIALYEKQFENDINAIREQYWLADLNYNISDELRSEYVRLLFIKDLYFITLKCQDRLIGGDGLIENLNKLSNEVIREFMAMASNQKIEKQEIMAMDQGIYPKGSFNEFMNVLFKAHKSPLDLMIFVNSIKNMNDLIDLNEDVKVAYESYITNRDIYEAYTRNNYTADKYERNWDEIHGRGYLYKHPYYRLRKFTSLEKLEGEILEVPIESTLNKWLKYETHFYGNKTKTSYNPGAYELRKTLELPESVEVVLFSYGEGERMRLSDTITLGYYSVLKNTKAKFKDRLGHQVRDINTLDIIDPPKVKEERTAIKDLPPDLRIVTLLLKKGGCALITSKQSINTSIDRSMFFNYTSTENRYTALIKIE